MADTASDAYARRLAELNGKGWKRAVRADAPYRWNVQRLALGRTLDVGCGIGRVLRWLEPGSVGVDHNPLSVRLAREAGLDAWVPEEFFASPSAVPGAFDSLLLSHVVEHLAEREAVDVIGSYLPYAKADARLALITPQERGFASDASHVLWSDFAYLERLADGLGFALERRLSFPFPRLAGRVFTYNEFVCVFRRR